MFGTFPYFEDLLRDDVAVIGFPAPGSGHSLFFNGELAISAQSQRKEGAWEFVKFMLQYGETYGVSNMNFNVLGTSLELQIQEARTRQFDPVSQTDIDKVLAAVDAADNVFRYSGYDDPIAQLIIEEAEAFWAGDKSAQETADLIQGRVQRYVSEQS